MFFFLFFQAALSSENRNILEKDNVFSDRISPFGFWYSRWVSRRRSDMIPGFHLVHWHMTLVQAAEPGSYLVHTRSDTGNCFLLLQRGLTAREGTEALRAAQMPPSSPRWCHPAGPFRNTDSERNSEVGLSGSPLSRWAKQRHRDRYGRFSRFSHKLFAP